LVFVFLTIGDVTIPITVQNNNVALQVCAAVSAISAFLLQPVTCVIGQKTNNGGGNG